MRCPRCKEAGIAVIYAGFPMKLCSGDECSTLWGFWSWLPRLWFNGVFMRYDGWYVPALWHWLSGDLD